MVRERLLIRVGNLIGKMRREWQKQARGNKPEIDCSEGIAKNPPLPPDHPAWKLKPGDKVRPY